MARGTKNNNQVTVSCWVSPSSPSTRLCPLHFLPKIKKGQDKHKICFLKIKKWLTGKKKGRQSLCDSISHDRSWEISCVLFEWFSRCQFSNLCYSSVELTVFWDDIRTPFRSTPLAPYMCYIRAAVCIYISDITAAQLTLVLLASGLELVRPSFSNMSLSEIWLNSPPPLSLSPCSALWFKFSHLLWLSQSSVHHWLDSYLFPFRIFLHNISI